MDLEDALSLDVDARLRLLRLNAVEVLRAAGHEAEARRLQEVPLRADNRYGCVAKVLWGVELSLRAGHAVLMNAANAPHPLLIEAVAIVRLGLDAAGTSTGRPELRTEAFLDALGERQRDLLRALQKRRA